ncbi:hypothetical protein RM531_05320 [Salinisphaera sp. P385]|uniref:Uncharacterized protein n=1 Tax=Spectribacter acetivorans TaxID=3075603 RepID=A0ABU3B6R6_9GAMM|nr:hypothetical protein [Salinisphaera sp. P385]MDT0617883.1 hypothetical protein [Salinisphaera sp. P385]
MEDLEPNNSDRFVSYTRLVGAIASVCAPGLAPVAAEVVANAIPNQRFDRVVRQMQQMQHEIDVLKHEKSVLEANLASQQGRALLEEGLVQTANETDEEVRKFIGSLLARSMTEEELDYYRTQKILRILDELIHPELIWLIYSATCSKKPLSPESADTKLPDKDEFERRHSNILKGDRYTLIGRQKEMDTDALARSYKNKLLRLDLIAETKRSGKGYYQVTDLGYLVVRYILSPLSGW